MFIKIVVILLLLIVAVSLLTGRRHESGQRALRPQLRVLMLRVAIVLLLLTGIVGAWHLSV